MLLVSSPDVLEQLHDVCLNAPCWSHTLACKLYSWSRLSMLNLDEYEVWRFFLTHGLEKIDTICICPALQLVTACMWGDSNCWKLKTINTSHGNTSLISLFGLCCTGAPMYRFHDESLMEMMMPIAHISAPCLNYFQYICRRSSIWHDSFFHTASRVPLLKQNVCCHISVV